MLSGSDTTMRGWRRAALVLMLVLAGCGSSSTTITAADTINGGSTAITTPATYQYALSTQCGLFKLTSDSGTADKLQASGTVYLTAGNWSGSCYEVDYTGGFSAVPCLILPYQPACPGSIPQGAPYDKAVPGAWTLILTAPG